MRVATLRDLRNRTAALLRRVEADERLRVNVNQRPVAELVPLGRPQWGEWCGDDPRSARGSGGPRAATSPRPGT